MTLDLDRWLPDPQITTRHSRTAEVGAERLWDAASNIRLRDTPVLGRAVRWRIPGTSADIAFRRLLSSYPFTVLDEGETWSVSGICGRLWTLRRDYPEINGDDFRAWDRPGTVRAVIAHWVEDAQPGSATLMSESRVQAVDRSAALRMRALWTVVGRFERLIGGEALRVAVRAANEGDGSGPTSADHRA
jgi:hypothetical protein